MRVCINEYDFLIYSKYHLKIILKQCPPSQNTVCSTHTLTKRLTRCSYFVVGIFILDDNLVDLGTLKFYFVHHIKLSLSLTIYTINGSSLFSRIRMLFLQIYHFKQHHHQTYYQKIDTDCNQTLVPVCSVCVLLNRTCSVLSLK